MSAHGKNDDNDDEERNDERCADGMNVETSASAACGDAALIPEAEQLISQLQSRLASLPPTVAATVTSNLELTLTNRTEAIDFQEVDADEYSAYVLPLVFDDKKYKVYYRRFCNNQENLEEIRMPTSSHGNPISTDIFFRQLREDAEKKLLTTRGRGNAKKYEIDLSKLKTLVEDSIEGTCNLDFVRKATDMAKVHLPKITEFDKFGEMYLQHSVYAPISDLFCAFGKDTNFRANQNIDCSHVVQLVTRSNPEQRCTARVTCKPDGAVTASGKFDVKATMELKPANHSSEEDKAKCILMTVMSILAMDAAYKESGAKEFGTQRDGGVAIPFIIGNHDYTRLFVTRLSQSGECPKIQHVMSGYFHDAQPNPVPNPNRDQNLVPIPFKTEFIAVVAVLLGRISAFCKTISQAYDIIVMDRPHSIERLQNAWPSTEKSSDESQTRSGSDVSSGPPQGKKRKASGNEEAALMVASQNGLVAHLEYPWVRRRTVPSSSQWHEDMEFYQQTSPFYFKGVLNGQNTIVFCKVWHDGDKHTSRSSIHDEIRYFKKANAKGVPTPKVLDDLTAMDIEFVPKGDAAESTRYHILVTTFEKGKDVDLNDLLDYSLSLVCTVLMLHNTVGVLHCDIKPSNVIWAAERRQALLVDFGHAQDEIDACSYTATEKYQAPEIFLGKPHSRKSDAFGVGRTIEEACMTILEGAALDKTNLQIVNGVKEVANLLCCKTESQRISLEQAQVRLQSCLLLSHPVQCNEKETKGYSRKRLASSLGSDTGTR